MNTAFPFKLDARGRTSAAARDEYINQLIEQVLLTRPGERVNQPELGTGIMNFVFSPGGKEVMAALKGIVHAALQKQMIDLIEIVNLDVQSKDSTLTVTVRYSVLNTDEQKTTKYNFNIDNFNF